jgi:hypothetical protein
MDKLIQEKLIEFKVSNITMKKPSFIIVNKKQWKKYILNYPVPQFTKICKPFYYEGIKVIRSNDIKKDTVVIV